MEYITIPQLAKFLGVSRITVYRKVKSGEIKATKIGKTYVISEPDIAHILGKKVRETDKKTIDFAVRKVVREYGELLKKLGKE